MHPYVSASPARGGAAAAAEGFCGFRKSHGEIIMLLPYNRNLTSAARSLRKEMTPQEKRLWYDFLRRYPTKFYRQRVIDNFIADFYCSKAKLIIELDGSQHFTEQGLAHDKERTAILESFGLKVIRFTNAEVERNFAVVCNEIDEIVKSRV